LQVNSGQLGQLAALSYLSGSRIEPSVDAVSAAIFKLLDTNNDGKLTREKLAAAESILMPLDEDDDEIVTTKELVPNATGQGTQIGAMMMMPNPAKPDAKNKNSIIFLVGDSKGPSAELVQRMQERYGPKSDKPAEKKLSRKDLGLDEMTFALLDAN